MVWLCFPGMTSSLARSKQIIGAHFQTLFSTIFLVFDVPRYSNRFDDIKDIRPAIYFNNQKIIAYHPLALSSITAVVGHLKLNTQ